MAGSLQLILSDFCDAAYETTGTERTLHDAWSGDHMGLYVLLSLVISIFTAS